MGQGMQFSFMSSTGPSTCILSQEGHKLPEKFCSLSMENKTQAVEIQTPHSFSGLPHFRILTTRKVKIASSLREILCFALYCILTGLLVNNHPLRAPTVCPVLG